MLCIGLDQEVTPDLEPRLAEAGLGSLSEVYDAEPPHAPRGCIARAWTVGELLRAWSEDLRETPGDAAMERPKPSQAPRKTRSRNKAEA